MKIDRYREGNDVLIDTEVHFHFSCVKKPVTVRELQMHFCVNHKRTSLGTL